MANAISDKKDKDEALRLFHQALTVLKELSAADPRNSQIRLNLAFVHCRIADWLLESGDRAAALHEYHEAESLDAMLLARDPGNFDFTVESVSTLWQLSHALASGGECLAAAEVNRKALDLAHATAMRLPANLAALILEPRARRYEGDMHATCAATVPAQRLEHWRKAREAYQSSLDGWMRLKPRKEFTGRYNEELTQAGAAVERCDRELQRR